MPDLKVGQRVYAPHLGYWSALIVEIDDYDDYVIIREHDREEVIHCAAFDGKWNAANNQWELEE